MADGFNWLLEYIQPRYKNSFENAIEINKKAIENLKIAANKELDATKEKYDKKLDETEEKYDFMKEISEQLCLMLNNEEFSDFKITVNEKTYFAHKVVLASHSEVFAAMFRSDMKESHNNNVVIDDCDSDVFEVFLNYLYTGDMTKVKPMSEQLLPLSEKYQIKPLKTICEKYFKIINENAINAVIMADKYLANRLKERALKHIITNIQDIRSKFTEQFKQFIKDRPDLAYSIIASIGT